MKMILTEEGEAMTKPVFDWLILTCAAAMAVFVIVFHATLRPPSERLPEVCEMARFYSDPTWPWANHVECVDGDFAP